MVARERLFEDVFTNFDEVYEAVIIDVAPSISLMQACAMVYARHFLIPVAMDSLSVSGAGASLFYASTISRACRVPIKPIALLPTIVNKRIGLTEIVMNMIHALGQQNNIPTIGPIRTDTAVGKAHRAHQFLADFDPKSKALEDYELVANQLLEFFGMAVQEPHERAQSRKNRRMQQAANSHRKPPQCRWKRSSRSCMADPTLRPSIRFWASDRNGIRYVFSIGY